MNHGFAGLFWAALPMEHWPAPGEHRNTIEAKFESPYGDRRQEIVFIGQELDQEQATLALDQCLLTDREIETGPEQWKMLPDPFPEWIAEIEEDEA